MMQANLKQGVVLKRVVDVLKELVQECNIDCSAEAMTIQAMDSSHVALVALQLQKSGFEEYRCDKNATIGVNITSLNKVLRCAGNDDTAKLTYEENNDTLKLEFENSAKGQLSEFNLKLMEIDAESLGIPDQDYVSCVWMPSSEFQRICRDLSTLSDTITIAVSKEGIRFSATGDVGTGSVLVKNQAASADADKEDVTRIEMQEAVTQNFALRYLNTFSKAQALSVQVKLSLSKDMPLMVMYSMKDLGHIQFYLAPKIDEDDADE